LPTSGQEAFYQYDAGGQRVRKRVVTGTTSERRYVGGWEVYREYDSGENVEEERSTLHVADGQSRVLLVETKTVTGGVAETTLDPVLRYQLGDHLGTVAIELDEDGGFISYEEYSPYGATAWWAGDSALVSQKRYKFTGMERDEETGLQCHGVRYYATWLGRWTSADPIGLGDGVNRYGYCHEGPAGGLDSSGTQEWPPEVPTGSDFVDLPNGGVRMYSDDFKGEMKPGSYRRSELVALQARDGGAVRKTSISGPLVQMAMAPLVDSWMPNSVGGNAIGLLAEEYPDEATAVAKYLDRVSRNEVVLAAEDVPLVSLGIAGVGALARRLTPTLRAAVMAGSIEYGVMTTPELGPVPELASGAPLVPAAIPAYGVAEGLLRQALRLQGLSTAPAGGFKQAWSGGGFDYEVRVHPADPKHGGTGSIYRVARRAQGVDANKQGAGWEYVDDAGVWHKESTLKPGSTKHPNKSFNPEAAKATHLKLPGGG
jgi:RHS repeat-associated protein